MDLPAVEMHYYVDEVAFEQRFSARVNKIIEWNRKILLGESNLFTYDCKMTLSKPFKNLIKLLVETGELNQEIYAAKDLKELNAALQKPQGIGGGLLRKKGTERWHLKDSAALLNNKSAINRLFLELGFSLQNNIEIPDKVDHCIIFGARVERMEKRIKETLHYLENGMETENIYLLGSNRKLIEQEINYLNQMNKNSEKVHTEAEAFEFLWSIYANKELVDKTSLINSTRTTDNATRPSTLTTLEDWLEHFDNTKARSIFALAEKPYSRMLDSLRITVCSNNQTASEEELIQRIKDTKFFFAAPSSSTSLLSTTLDEIARSVYIITKKVAYLENL